MSTDTGHTRHSAGLPTNVFVLSAGRAGSTTFARACEQISNYSVGHESRTGLTGPSRLAYPSRHIEVDNRLSWLLGRLDRAYGNDAMYVHLERDDSAMIRSHVARQDFGIMKAYREGILLNAPHDIDPEAVARDYLDTVSANIEWFLRDKPNHMRIQLEHATMQFPLLWERIGAVGNLDAALSIFKVLHNSTAARLSRPKQQGRLATRFLRKSARAIRGLPSYVRDV